MGFFEVFIQVEGHAGQIPEVFQQGKERKKDGHGRQHYRSNPGEHAVHAVYQHAAQPFGRAEPEKKFTQAVACPEEAVRQQLRGVVRPCNGQPENPGEKQQHDGDSRPFAGEDLVDLPVARIVCSVFEENRILTDAFRRGNEPHNDFILDLLRRGPRRFEGFPRPLHGGADIAVLHEVFPEIVLQRFAQRFIIINEAKGRPAGGEPPQLPAAQQLLHRGDGFFQLGGIAHRKGRKGRRAFSGELLRPLHQRTEPLSAPRARPHHGDTQLLLQFFEIDPYFFALRFVH